MSRSGVDLRASCPSQYVAEVLAKAPTVDGCQRSQLAELLRGVRQDTGLAEELKAERAAIEQRGKR